MSPTVLRRHPLMLGSRTPKRRSSKRKVEVWSNTSLHTQPPRVLGDITRAGTRKPSPIGPAIPAATLGSGDAVTHSPGVPSGAVGGGTWSNRPSFSS
jgi:hypothetical protein